MCLSFIIHFLLCNYLETPLSSFLEDGVGKIGFCCNFPWQFFQKWGKGKNKEKGKQLLLLLFLSVVNLQVGPPCSPSLVASPLEDNIYKSGLLFCPCFARLG